jgi:hypothetical protein
VGAVVIAVEADDTAQQQAEFVVFDICVVLTVGDNFLEIHFNYSFFLKTNATKF